MISRRIQVVIGGEGRVEQGNAYRPPTKCLPLKCLTNGFGAVKLISAVG